MLGIISGTVVLQQTEDSLELQSIVKVTAFGRARLLLSQNAVLLKRHGQARRYIPPHLINHRANLKALKEIGVSEIIGINSTGSLRSDWRPGAIVIPHDFIMPAPYVSLSTGTPLHITPSLDESVRERCIAAASAAGVEVLDGAVYWQTSGPRLETAAEIAMMSQFADLVGMTLASEAITAQELGLPYAAICSVDNFAHGIGREELSMAEISAQAKANGEKISRVLAAYLLNAPTISADAKRHPIGRV